MEIKATLNEHGAATLKATILNSTTHLDIADADGLAADIAAGLEVDQTDVFRDGYAVLIQPNGLKVTVGNNGFDIPWQHITSVVAQLRA